MVNQNIWRWIRPVLRPVLAVGIMIIFYLPRVFPIKKNKVIATAFGGIRYCDNPKSMLEALLELVPDADIVWIKGRGAEYELPEWIRTVHLWSKRWINQYATGPIWINNCLTPDFFRKRKDQLYIETWHGGLGIKKVFGDAECPALADAHDGTGDSRGCHHTGLPVRAVLR